MSIERFDFSNGSEEAFSVGLHISKNFGLTEVNIYALNQTTPGSINNNIWGLAFAVSRDVLSGESISDVNWNLHVGKVSSAIRFSTFNAEPYKIDISNKVAFQYEKMPNAAFSLEKYNEPPAPKRMTTPMTLFKRDVINAWQRGDSASVICVPCYNPNTPDSVFYCNADYSDSKRVRDDYDFILADAKLAIRKLEGDNPSMMQHADYKLKGAKVEEWAKSSSLLFPVSTGRWGASAVQQGKLNFYEGDASIIRVIQGLDLPFFPMAVSKGDGERLRLQIGYSRNSSQSFNMAPVFRQE